MTDSKMKTELENTHNDKEAENSRINDTTRENSISDIQNYLQTFNKEIETVQGDSSEVNDDDTAPNDSTETRTIFVTESGEFVYQEGNDNRVMTVVDSEANKQPKVATKQSKVSTYVRRSSRKKKNATNTETETQNKTEDVSSSQSGHIILGEEAFQTVTIVPTETNPGEVSYVLIVQQPDEGGEKEKQETTEAEDTDLTVYDFDDAEDPTKEPEESAEEDDKSKILKIVTKKSQSVSQAHMCNYCNYTSPKRYLLSRHMKSHSEERPHKCSVCDRGFKTIASLQNHVNTHTGTKPHRCKFCPGAFTTSGELVRHVRYKHTHEKPHKCSICDYASVELSKMRNHMRCHTGERPYQCQHCTYASPDSFKLKRHLRIHTGERPYECDQCPKKFTQSNSLKAHKLVHSEAGDKPQFKCDLCPAKCGRKTDLRIHVQKLHTSDRLFTCRRCGKTFPDRYTFKIHNKTHDGEKCWKCDFCPYASTCSRHLESHMLIHTDQKPFKCGSCDQSFRQKQLLKRHQNLYHNPDYVPPEPKEKTNECPECTRSFRHKGNLIRHMNMHDPNSETVQTQNALKLGRQKKIHVVNGEELKVVNAQNEEEEEEEEENEDVYMKEEAEIVEPKAIKNELENQLIEGADGQHYVVLEVIQLQGGEGDQAMAVVSEPNFQTNNSNHNDSNTVTEDHFITPHLNNGKSSKEINKRSKEVTDESCNDVQDCFGFDEECDDDEMNTD